MKKTRTHTPSALTRCHACAQGPRQRGEALLRGPCVARQSSRFGRECVRDGGHGDRRPEAALLMLAEAAGVATVGGDKGFDVASFVAGVRALGVTPQASDRRGKFV